MSRNIGFLILTFLMTSCITYNLHATSDSIKAPNGVIVGDVTSNSAVIWSRADRDSVMHVQLRGRHGKFVEVDQTKDYAGKVFFDHLRPDTEYHYTVEFLAKHSQILKDNASEKSQKLSGQFRTAPDAAALKAVKFAWGGDLAGQNACRDATRGFPIFEVLNREKWDFFIGLGDMIYADAICESVGRFGNEQIPGNFTLAADLTSFWAHWSYTREDEGFQKFLASTPYIAIWDDHEVVNDFGPLHDTRNTPPYTPGMHLLPIGLKAFLDYNPVIMSSETPNRLYRAMRWGKHVELFILDTRQYRDANFMPDNAQAPKSMLGREQVVWLKEKLAHSDATWKIIISSVPMSIPTGFPAENGRDGWANFDQDTGFEHELIDILRFIQKQGIKNNLWLSTDVHFATGFTYTPFSDAPDFEVHEFISGPLHAGLFPNEAFDDSLDPKRLFFHGSETTQFDTALDYFNFGAVEVNEQGELIVSIVNAKGSKVTEKTFQAK